MATLDGNDLKAIKDLIEVTIDEKLDQRLDEKLSHLPTKDEFYGTMDKVMGELKAIREEPAVLGHQVSDHGDRLQKLESAQAVLKIKKSSPLTPFEPYS